MSQQDLHQSQIIGCSVHVSSVEVSERVGVKFWLDRETYEKLRKFRFKLEVETMDEVISWLLKRESE